jgi:pimeloyl-ACP methyl ester carboxylesterase
MEKVTTDHDLSGKVHPSSPGRRSLLQGIASLGAGSAAYSLLRRPAEAQAIPAPQENIPPAFRPADHPDPPTPPGSSRAGKYYQVIYPPSTTPGELQLGVHYTFWMPDSVEVVRGVIVHQHGAGVEAAQAGLTAAYDLHWQALAKKWDCVLLGPSYLVTNNSTSANGTPGGASLWVDPAKGSDRAFLKAIGEVAEKSGHPELVTAPWCLWGHSAGGSWSRAMSLVHPERIAAIFLRSGGGGARPLSSMPASVFSIPTMAVAGVLEKGSSPWTGTFESFQQFRAQGAPVGFAADPRTGHFCGDSRYLAIPFFDACMSLRLPAIGAAAQTLRPVDQSHGWVAAYPEQVAVPAAKLKGDAKQTTWLPSAAVANAWMEYVKTGTVSDSSLPPPPFNVRVNNRGDQGTEVTWDAEADIASGLGGFIVLRDGLGIARLPAQPPEELFGRPLFQGLSFHDTPNAPLAKMSIVDTTTKAGIDHTYMVTTLSSAGVPSVPGGSPDGLRSLTGRFARLLPGSLLRRT